MSTYTETYNDPPGPGRAPMLGNTIPRGPGGRSCVCCYPAPGKARTKDKRAARHRERAAWKRDVRTGNV